MQGVPLKWRETIPSILHLEREYIPPPPLIFHSVTTWQKQNSWNNCNANSTIKSSSERSWDCVEDALNCRTRKMYACVRVCMRMRIHVHEWDAWPACTGRAQHTAWSFYCHSNIPSHNLLLTVSLGASQCVHKVVFFWRPNLYQIPSVLLTNLSSLIPLVCQPVEHQVTRRAMSRPALRAPANWKKKQTKTFFSVVFTSGKQR